MSFSGKMIKQTGVHSCYGVLLRNKNKQTVDICDNLNESSGNYTNWEKANSQTLENVYHVFNIHEMMKFQKWITDQQLPEMRGEEVQRGGLGDKKDA